jgi:hypothetical protein
MPPLNADERTTLESWLDFHRATLATWRAEIARAREHCADRGLADTGRFAEQDVSLRWIYVHMIEEYARHNGHADLLRERIDGTTGV